MRRECRERLPRHRGLAIPTCITARPRHSWRMGNPQFYVSGKGPMGMMRMILALVMLTARVYAVLNCAEYADYSELPLGTDRSKYQK